MLTFFKANVNCAVILESHLVRRFNQILWRFASLSLLLHYGSP